MYYRVLPRDAFNDANLLKCIGKLTMMIEDGEIPWMGYKYTDNTQPFNIIQDSSDGSTYVKNIHFYVKEGMRSLDHRRPLNSRYNYPLILYFEKEGELHEFYPFDEDGNFILSETSFV